MGPSDSRLDNIASLSGEGPLSCHPCQQNDNRDALYRAFEARHLCLLRGDGNNLQQTSGQCYLNASSVRGSSLSSMNLDDKKFLSDLGTRIRDCRLARKWTQA